MYGVCAYIHGTIHTHRFVHGIFRLLLVFVDAAVHKESERNVCPNVRAYFPKSAVFMYDVNVHNLQTYEYNPTSMKARHHLHRTEVEC